MKQSWLLAALLSLACSGNATSNGGAIFNAGTLTLTGGTVSSSSATGYGGGIYNTGTLRLSGTTVSDNAANVEGGGIDNAGQGRLTVVDSTVRRNTGLYGGGIRNGARAALFNSSLSATAASSAVACSTSAPGARS